MSDSTPEKSDKKSKPKTRGQKWRRRIIILLSIFVIGMVLVRLLVPVLLPVVMRSVAGRYGMNAEYDKLEFYMLGGDVGIWNLRFTPQKGEGQVLQVDYCRGSVSTLGLLRGQLNVSRAEAEGADLYLAREADGSVPLLEQFLSSPAASAVVNTAKSETNIPLESPLTIRALRLQHATAHISDRAVMPATNLQFMLSMILTDVGSPDKPTRYSIQINSPEMLGALYLDGEGTSRNKQVNATVVARVFGLNPVAVKPYLAMLGISPVNAEMNAVATGKMTITPAKTNPNDPPDAPVKALSAKVELKDIELTNQSQPSASVKSITIDAPVLSPGEIRVDSINIDSVTAAAWRDANGRIGFAGLSIGADSAPAVPATQPASIPGASSNLPVLVLKSLKISHVATSFTDWALLPRVTENLNFDEISLTDISTDPADKDQVALLKIVGHAPGNVQSINIDGSLSMGQPLKILEGKLVVSGIDGAGLDPYFNRLGITRALKNATLTSNLHADLQSAADGTVSINAKASDVKFSDSESEWFVAPGMTIDSFSIDPTGKKFAVKSIDIAGPVFNIKRAGKGEITALGLTFDPRAKIEGIGPINLGSTAPSTQPATQSALKLPAISIGSFHWGGVNIGYEDTFAVPAVIAGLNDVDVSVTHFVIDPDSKQSTPGDLKVAAKLPGILEQFALTGKLHPTGNSIAIETTGKVSGLTLTQLKPFLLTLGIEPQLKDGLITFTTSTNLRLEPQALNADLSVKDFSYTDGDQVFVKNQQLGFNGISLAGDKVMIDSISIDQTNFKVHRDAEGLVSAFGLRLVTPVGGKPKKISDEPILPSRIDLSLPLVATIKSLRLNGATIDYDDQAVRPIADMHPVISASIENLVVGTDSDPAKLTATAASPGLIEKLTLEGVLKLSPASQQISGIVAGFGISGNALQGYLPPGVIPSATNGQLSAKFSAGLKQNEAGGSTINASVSEVVFNDGLANDPAIKLDNATLAITRFDLDAKLIAIDEISASGFSARAIQDDRGFVLPGLVVGAKTNFEPAPVIKSAEPQAATGDAPNLADVMKQANAKSPLVTVKKLSLNADRLSFQLSGMTEPITLADAKIANTSPIELLGEDPAQRPAFDILTTARVPKFVDSINLNSKLAPYAAEPSAKLTVDVSGINGKELTTVIPTLGKYIDGSSLNGGKVHSEIDSQFTFTRRGMLGIDLTRDITSNFSVKNTSYTQDGEEKPFASLQEIKGEKAKISPLNGSIAINNIEITKPQARLMRDKSGIHLLGLTIKDPSQKAPASTQPATQPEQPAAEIVAPTTEPVAVAQTEQPKELSLEQKAGGDFKIDTLTVSGIDLVIEDRVGTPATILPITDLDAEVKGINTRALTEPLPIRFNVLVGSGKIQLPARKPKIEGETEEREIFSQLTASGKLNVYPKPDGYVKMSLSGFDLLAASGIVQPYGISLGGGTFDFAADVRMQGADTFEAKLYPTFTDLKVSEPENGPIRRALKLNGPLNGVIGVIQGADGSISLPVRAPMKAGQLDIGAIYGSAIGAVSAQIAVAIASTPFKAIDSVAAVAGIPGFSWFGGKDNLDPIKLTFPAGESQPSDEQMKQIQALVKRMRSENNLQLQLVHNLATGDEVLTQLRANPSVEMASQIAQQLRSKKFDLQKQSLELSSVLKVALASQNKSLADQTLAQLQQVSSQIAQNEQAMDDTLNLLRPGADKQSDRRTKLSSMELGKSRLDAIKGLLKDPKIADFETRVSSQKPLPATVDGLSEGNITIILSRAAKK